MTKKHKSRKRRAPQDEGAPAALSRRDFVKAGAAAGAGAAVLSAPGKAQAQSTVADIRWDYEVDIVVCGSGCTGLPAAIRARDLGASVLVIDANFDVGGKLLHSGGWSSYGGGDAIQERDRMAADPDGMGLTEPLVPPEDLEDDPDRLFQDMTDWSVVTNAGTPYYRHNDRGLHRGWADNAAATRQFTMDNYVRYARINGTHSGGGMSRGRSARAIMKLADVTDIRAGTLSPEDRGDPAAERHSPFNPMRRIPGNPAEEVGAPGWVFGGFTIARPLEFSAREKGVQFMVNRHLDEIIREQPLSGRVVGVQASYTPRFNPETGERLESFWQNGNVDERADTIYIRARRAVIIGTGGMHGNVQLRTMFDPRMTEPSIGYSGNNDVGPLSMDGSGIIAGMRIGANLAGMMHNYFYDATPGIRNILATQATTQIFPGHPGFLFGRSWGVSIGNSGWENVITVNQVGQRFYNEMAIPDDGTTAARYSGPGGGGQSNTRDPWVPLDWRNASVEHIKAAYSRTSASDAALAMNEGSRAPTYSSGPVWAIFDAAAVERGGWELRYPYIADPPDGYFFQADTLAELARIATGNPYQTMPLKYLEETVAKFNGFADAGMDDDFEKPVMHRIDTPPFYALIAPMYVGDSYGGLRINGKAQVVDTEGQVVPGLYAGGEASGGGMMHGIGRAAVHGYMAGTNAV